MRCPLFLPSPRFSQASQVILILSLFNAGYGIHVDAEDVPPAESPNDPLVEYVRDIEPIIKRNCVACHNGIKDEAGVNLESPSAIKSSDADNLLVPGQPEASRMFLLASHADEPLMPPENNDVQAKRLNAMELVLLKRWIEQGARLNSKTPSTDEPSMRPLPSTLHTIYASSITEDGNLSAVAFGNRIELFTRASNTPFQTITQFVDNRHRPAHDDFVHAMKFSPDGQTLVSAGYRNIRIWRMQSTSPVSIPMINASEVAAVAINSPGTHLATFSVKGEVSVASFGKQRWDWMKGFDPSVANSENVHDTIGLALCPSGQIAVVGFADSIRVVRVDSAVVETLPCHSHVKCAAFTDDKTFYSGHVSGDLTRYQYNDGKWTSTSLASEASPMSHVVASESPGVVGVNDAGKVWRWNSQGDSLELIGALPSPADGIAITPGKKPVLWVVSTSGSLGIYDLAASKYQEIAKTDPAAEQQLRRDQWEVVVAARIQSAVEMDLKTVEANMKAEQDSLEKVADDVETQQRLDSFRQEAERQKAIVERSKVEVTQSQDREKASKSFAEQSRAASGTPIVMDGGKVVITPSVSNQTSESSGSVNWWAENGTWLGASPIDGEIIAVGGTTFVTRDQNQSLIAHRVAKPMWQLERMIGSVTGDSPFEDRVLSVDIDPSGRYLATGGGLPSRSGELMLWNLADRTLFRRFDNPHHDTVMSIRFSPDGKTLASGGADQLVHLWDVESGDRLATLEGHTHHVTAVAWGLDGREAASAAADGVVKIWDLKTKKASRTISDLKSEVTQLVYLGSEARIGLISGDGDFDVYRTSDGRRETHTKIPAGYLYTLDRTRDAGELIIGGSEGTAFRVDKNGKILQTYSFQPSE
ncbi:WD40 domain-containing protein [Neorhodopirellula pilleata]|uniref:WD40 domain-containing protein n=1 Tax=Neorhodopirellula pilleata TaxID=2714738 RepID=UPI0018CDC94D|nr:c-type cytochrome domain-containing protein [Neorhodopirellula pilleata]